MEKLFKQVSDIRDKVITGSYSVDSDGLKSDPFGWEHYARKLEKMVCNGDFLPVPESPEAEELTIIRNKLYDSMPTGQIDAFELITIISLHLKELDAFIDYSHLTPKPKGEDDLIEKVKEWLYAAHGFGEASEGINTPVFDAWVEEKTGELSEYYKSVK